ncbi:MAG: DUF2125 domain-containing protein [Phyllobacterium sp.]
MPSSNVKIDNKDRGSSGSRRILILGIGILIAIGLYTAGWFVLANQLENRVIVGAASLASDGVTATCENATAKGYPFRIGLSCKSVTWIDRSRGVAVSTGAFRSAAQVYAPRRVVSELDGPVLIEMPGLLPLKMQWENLKSSARLTDSIPERVSVVGRNIDVALRTQASGTAPVATIANAESHMRNIEKQIDAAWTFDGLKIDPAFTDGTELPALTGSGDVSLANGVDFLHRPGMLDDKLRGQSGEIRQLALSLGNDGGFTISGPFSVADDGRISGSFKIVLNNPDALAAAAHNALPEFADEISTAQFAIQAMPRDEKGQPTVTVTVRNGKASIGFIPLGRLPAL